MDTYQKLLKLGMELENNKDYSLRISKVLREINAAPAKADGIEISSWQDFLTWWGNNRGQNLKYIFIDTFGGDSEEAKKVSELLKEADKHEANLHAFYMFLRNKAKQQKALLKQQSGEVSPLETGEEKVDLEPDIESAAEDLDLENPEEEEPVLEDEEEDKESTTHD
jgi:hypothetical protein